MKTGNFEVAVQMCMKDGDIAETDDPFGIFFEFSKPDAIDDAADTISPTGTEYRPYLIIVEHVLEFFQPLPICPGKIVLRGASQVWSNLHVVSPVLHCTDAYLRLFIRHVPCWTNYTDSISRFEICRNFYHVIHFRFWEQSWRQC